MRVVWLLSMAVLFVPAAGVAAGDLLFNAQPWIMRYNLETGEERMIALSFGAGLGAACSPDGYVYFSIEVSADPGWIRRWDYDGGSFAEIEFPDPGDRPWPAGIAFDTSGDLWINTRSASGVGHGVWRLSGGDPTKTPELVIPPFGSATFRSAGSAAEIVAGGPHAGGLLLGAKDAAEVYLSEPPGAPVRLFLPSSAFPSASEVWAIATNPCGEVFVGSYGSTGGRVDHFDAEGVFIELYASGFPSMVDIEFDSEGNLYVSHLSQISKIAPDRRVTLFAKSGISESDGIAICRGPLACSAGGTYRVDCSAGTSCLALSASPRPPCGTYNWTTDCPGGDFGGTDASPEPTLCLPSTDCAAHCHVSLTLKDGSRMADCTAADVEFADTTPPDVEAGTGDLSCLWPPNHRYVCFGRTGFSAAVTDSCDATPTWKFTGCASDQPDDADERSRRGAWEGDGHTTHDCVVRSGGAEICVRAERAGKGPTAAAGRRYAVEVVAVDECGNESAPTVIGSIRVPHDAGCRDAVVLAPPSRGVSLPAATTD